MKSLLEIVNNIEDELDVENWKYEDIYIWPLYRFYIHTKLRASKAAFQNLFFEKLKRIIGSLFSLRSVCTTIVHLKKISNVDIVFLSNSSFKRFKKGNKWVDPYVHPVAKSLDELDLKYQILETDLKKNKKNDNYVSLINIDDLVNFIYFFIAPFFLIWSSIIHKFKANKFFSNQINQSLNKKDINLQIPEDIFFIKQLANLKAKSFIFKIILRRLNARYGVITGYGSQEGLSFCMACNALGIKSIELQHGVISEEMPRYGKWFKVPDDGYEVLPNLFWCWNENDYKFIHKWSKDCNEHHVKKGGNLFIKNYKNYLDNEALLKNDELNKRAMSHKKFVLYALQAEEWQSEWLLDKILNQDLDILWGFRFHPSYYSKAREDNIRNKFKERGLSNYDFNLVNHPSMNILNCIDLSDAVISAFSSSLLESIMLKKHACIIHKEGIEHYKQYIDQKKINVACDTLSFNKFVSDLFHDKLPIKKSDEDKDKDKIELLKEVFSDN